MCVLVVLYSVLAFPAGAQEVDSRGLRGPYLGQEPPEDEPALFAPGVVSNGSNHCSVSISQDGSEIYWELGSKIGYSRLEDGEWTSPQIVPFCAGDPYRYGNPFITSDGTRLFFTSFRAGAASQNKENIWFSERTPTGWSEPKPVSPEVNALRIHWSVSVSDSCTLYFQGTRKDSDKETDGIYYSRLVNGAYTEPVRMGPEINGGYSETCPHVAPDELYIVFNRFAPSDPNNCGIFISYKDDSGKWLPATMLLGGSPDKGGMSPRVTPDGKYLFYVNGGVWWMRATMIEAARPK